jgi:ferredoxin-NADP reductase
MGGIVELAGLVIILAAVVQAATGVSSVLFRASAQHRRSAAELDSLKERARILLERATSERDRTELSWNGKRKFRIERRDFENQAKDICSFYLVPHDNRPIPPYRAGQFLTFELPIPGQPQPVVRCYSLSDTARADHYRVTIKKLGPPPDAPDGTPFGLSSSYFHDQLQAGEIVEAMAPAGEFFLDEESERPVVLIGGGVGLTPVVSMLNALVEHGSHREVWFFYGVRNRSEHAMYDHLKRIDAEHANVHMVICYSQPADRNLPLGNRLYPCGFRCRRALQVAAAVQQLRVLHLRSTAHDGDVDAGSGGVGRSGRRHQFRGVRPGDGQAHPWGRRRRGSGVRGGVRAIQPDTSMVGRRRHPVGAGRGKRNQAELRVSLGQLRKLPDGAERGRGGIHSPAGKKTRGRLVPGVHCASRRAHRARRMIDGLAERETA